MYFLKTFVCGCSDLFSAVMYVYMSESIRNFNDNLYLLRYLDSVQCLEKEAGVNLKKFEICDNIDLQIILQVRFLHRFCLVTTKHKNKSSKRYFQG